MIKVLSMRAGALSIGAFNINWTGDDRFSLNNPFDEDPWYQDVLEIGGWYTNISDIGSKAWQFAETQYGKRKYGFAYDYIKDVREVATPPWYGNFLGPGPKISSEMLELMISAQEDLGIPIAIDMLDLAALRHDLAYSRAGVTGGPMSAFFDRSVFPSDFRLVYDISASLFSVDANRYHWGALLFAVGGSAKALSYMPQYY